MPPTLIIADGRDRGQTLAAVLKARLGLPWSQAKRVIERRQVRVGAQIVADPTYRVKTGKRITIAAGAVEMKKPAAPPQSGKATEPARPERPKVARERKATPPAQAKAPRHPLRDLASAQGEPEILYADDAIVVVNKPAGLTTMRHAEEAAEFGKGKRFLPRTLEDRLPALLGEPGCSIFAVHRIDRDTSGVVVFARTPAAAEKLTRQFRKHTADRRYLALVRGEPKPGRIESTLVRDRGDGRRGSTTRPDPEGKHAVTHVSVLEQFGRHALVECRLETGRTHQVRIHLGEAGTPLCGEKIYDRPVSSRPHPDGSGAKRPMLHAARLSIDHPSSGERRSWETAPPQDFAGLLDRLRTQSI